MTPRWSIIPAVLLVVTSAAMAGSTDDVTGELTASKIEAAGYVSLESPLLAFTRFDLSADNLFPAGAQTPDPVFQLHASLLRVESWEADPYGRATSSYVAAPAESSNKTYRDANLDGVAVRPGYRFDVFPEGAALAQVSSDCAELQASTKDTYAAVPKVSAASPTFETNVANAILWTECGQSSVTITGSFVLALWEWDAEIHANGQTVALPSGLDRTSTAPEPAASLLYPTVSHARQQYLYAQDAVLTIPRMDATTHWAYLGAPQVNVEGTLRFANATGQLHQDGIVAPVQATALTVSGDLNLAAIESTGQGGTMQSSLAGTIHSIDADGQAVTIATNGARPAFFQAWWLLGFLGLGLVAVPVLVPRRRVAHRLQIALWQSQTRFMNLDFEGARHWAHKALDLDPGNGLAHYRLAQAQSELGNPHAALQHHAKAHQLLTDKDLLAENAVQAALAAMALHRLDEAQSWLQHALRTNPHLRDTLPDDSPLHDVMDAVPYWMRP